jgi:hypothetical protein
MTVGASLATRVLHGQLSVLYDRRRSVVSPKPKSSRDEELPDDKIDDHQRDDRHDEMAYLLRYPFPHNNNPV